jgi:hypothetical protein
MSHECTLYSRYEAAGREGRLGAVFDRSTDTPIRVFEKSGSNGSSGAHNRALAGHFLPVTFTK